MYTNCKNFLERVANIGTDESYDFSKNRKIRTSNLIGYIGVITFMAYFLFLKHLDVAFLWTNLLGIFTLGSVIFLNWKRQHLMAQLWLCLDVSAVTVVFAYTFGEKSLSEYFLIACSVLPLFFFEKKRHFVPLFLFVVGCYLICLFVYDYTDAPAKELMNSELGRTLSIANILTVFFILFSMVRVFKDEQNRYTHIIEEQKDQLEESREEILMQKEEIEVQAEELATKSNILQISLEDIQHKNREITSSINYARRIQSAMLPLESEVAESFNDFFLFFRPRDIVSGDFYWFYQKQNLQIIAVGDCTGHGVPGAFMSMIGSSLLDKIVRDEQITETGKILTELHLAIRLALKQANSESRDGMDMTICTIDKNDQKLQFSGAKNPLYFVQDGKMNIIKGDKFSIGGHQREIKRIFQTHEISINLKTIIYLFSDGYQDQFGGLENRKFMTKRFRNLLFEHYQKPLSNQKQILETTLNDWIKIGDEKQTDDILIIGIEI